MRILADENIPHVRELFDPLGEVQTVRGRSILPEDLRGFDLLLVRSVTPVGESLLKGSRVRFVATATAGTDHVDQAYLRRQGIAFASAPGSNAAAVADYVSTALLVASSRLSYPLKGKTLGVIGHGQVGSRVAARGRALGMRVLVNDPPLARQTGDPLYRPLDEVLAAADVVALHCCLTAEGPYPSYHLADTRFFDRLRPGSLFINAARGEVTDEAALRHALESEKVRAAILDVWETEPVPDSWLLRRALLATPHIGGYSEEGKLRGAQQIYEAACRFLGREPVVDLPGSLPSPDPIRIEQDTARKSVEACLLEIVRRVYDIEGETEQMRAMAEEPPAARRELFDRLRRAHGPRREFSSCSVELPPGGDPELGAAFSGLGFSTA